jgi:2OG-Fe(II) oxygenase superfamily
MLSNRYFVGCPALDLERYMRLTPWPHLVLDGFLQEESLGFALDEIESRAHDFKIDYRGSGRIEFSILHSPTLWRALYSAATMSVLSEAFGCEIKLNKANLIQLRRMNSATPEFPVHHDYVEGAETIVSFLHLSSGWTPQIGGRLLLYRTNDPADVWANVEPIQNRLVAFRTLSGNWHSVEKVHHWERRSVLAVWDAIS